MSKLNKTLDSLNFNCAFLCMHELNFMWTQKLSGATPVTILQWPIQGRNM